MNNISMKMYFSGKTTGPLATVKMQLVYDKKPTGLIPTPATDIWESADVIAHPRAETQHRFKVLKEWIIGVSNNSTGGDGSGVHKGTGVYKDYIKLKGAPVLWTPADTTGVLANLEHGALYFVVTTDTSTGTTSTDMAFEFRLTFDDVHG
jgi:hypothetical protein